MIRPRPAPPYLPMYPASEHDRIQHNHEMDLLEWQRETSVAMWLNSAMVLIATAGVVAAALMGPPIVLDAMVILWR